MEIYWENAAAKKLLKIDPIYQRSINEAVKALAQASRDNLDIKKLRGYKDTYRLRVGNYRVIFKFINSVPRIVLIKDINTRESSYKK